MVKSLVPFPATQPFTLMRCTNLSGNALDLVREVTVLLDILSEAFRGFPQYRDNYRDKIGHDHLLVKYS